MPNNLTLTNSPASECPHPIIWCGLRLCFSASDYTSGAAANAFVRFELDIDNVPWAVGSTLTVFGITFTVVSGTPTGPNQVSSSSSASGQWSNFRNALLAAVTGGGQPFTDYYSITGGAYITITSIAPGSNPPAPAGLFSGGVIVDSFGDGTAGVNKTGYHIILDLYRKVGGSWQKICGQNDHTYFLPLQETSGGNGVCFDISGALSVSPTPPAAGLTWFLQPEAVAIYYARYAAFYRDDDAPCGNVYSSYEDTEEFRVVNAVFALTNPTGFAPYCPAASGADTQIITDMPILHDPVCCNSPIWWSIYYDPDVFGEPNSLEYIVETLFSGGYTHQETFPIGSGAITDPSWFTFLANPNGCAMPEGVGGYAWVSIELDEPNFTIGSTFTLFGITLTVVSGTPGINELNPDPNPVNQASNLYNALLAAEISPGVPFTSLYSITYGFYITITALSSGLNPPNTSGNFSGGILVDSNPGGGGTPLQTTITIKAVGGDTLYAPRTLYLKSGNDCCCTTPLYFVGELGNIDYIEGSCTAGIDLELDAITTGKPESCADWVNSGIWEVNNSSKELQTCYIAVRPTNEKYVRNFLKSANKFWLDAETQKYYRIIPAQKKYTLRRGDDRVFVEFSFYVSYPLPNQIN